MKVAISKRLDAVENIAPREPPALLGLIVYADGKTKKFYDTKKDMIRLLDCNAEILQDNISAYCRITEKGLRIALMSALWQVINGKSYDDLINDTKYFIEENEVQ